MARSPQKWLFPPLALVALTVIVLVILSTGEAEQITFRQPSTQKRTVTPQHLAGKPKTKRARKTQPDKLASPLRFSTRKNQPHLHRSRRSLHIKTSPPRVKPSRARLVFKRPRLKQFKKHLRRIEKKTLAIKSKKRTRKYPFVAIATSYRSKIYANTDGDGSAVSLVRRGSKIPIKSLVNGSGCDNGNWYKEGGTGYICTSLGFSVYPKHRKVKKDYIAPLLHSAEPYDYAKVIDEDAFRYRRLPTLKEVKATKEAAFNEDRLPSYAIRQLKGDFFVAWGKEFKKDGRVYVRTPKDTYIPKEALERFPKREMHGEVLRNGRRLPLAFVYEDRVPVYRMVRSKPVPIGLAQKHSRFFVRRTLVKNGKTWIFDKKGRTIFKKHLRICRTRPQPRSLQGTDRWIHVDLSEQTLVAYRGNRPVFATLVSTGVEGHSTPLGLYRIEHKQITTTMNGSDDEVGWYDVGEVPWTMYYRKLYAIHGAYWHDNFGKRQSHGCTNLAPADAKWLFHWTEPKRPIGWHTAKDEGTHVWFTQ